MFTVGVNSLAAIHRQTPLQNYFGYSCVNVMFEAVAVFELFKNIHFKENKYSKFIVLMSKWSFGAYLVHALIIELLSRRLGLTTLSFSSYIAVPTIGLVVFICSYLVSAVLNCIPLIKKYIV